MEILQKHKAYVSAAESVQISLIQMEICIASCCL